MNAINAYNIVRNIFAGALMMIGVSYLIALYFGYVNGGFLPASPELVESVGVLKAAEMLAFYSALIGASFGGMRFVWKIDSWSILKSTAVYFGVNVVVILFCGYKMCWFPHTAGGFFGFISVFVAIFVSIWLVMYLKGKGDAKRINSKLQETRNS